MNFLSKALIVIPFLLMSCTTNMSTHIAPPPSPSFAPRVIDPTCVDLVEKMFQSPVLVQGGFVCLSDGFQKFMTDNFGVTDDASFADFVSTYPPVATQACGDAQPYDGTHNYKNFLNQDQNGTIVLVRFYFRQSDGKVDELQDAGAFSAASVKTKTAPTCDTSVVWPKPRYIE